MAVGQTVIGQLPFHLDKCKTNRCQSIVLVSQIAHFCRLIATFGHLSIRSFMAVAQTVIGQLPLHLDEC
jgi:hypothetical protein